ncbi:hypothetical protein ACX80G_09040 [Arthrobacter sp. HLT1-21]
MGATGTVTFPAEPAEDVEALRTTIGEGPTTYASVSVDNPAGESPINSYQIFAYTQTGEEIPCPDDVDDGSGRRLCGGPGGAAQ